MLFDEDMLGEQITDSARYAMHLRKARQEIQAAAKLAPAGAADDLKTAAEMLGVWIIRESEQYTPVNEE